VSAAQVFTPKIAGNLSERWALRISPEDAAKMPRGEPWSAIVTDLQSGQQFSAQSAPCGIPTCYCDAVAEQVAEQVDPKPEIDVYQTAVFIGPGNELPEEPEALHQALAAHRADVELAMLLLKLNGVELQYLDYDHHYGGSYVLTFETTDSHLAEVHDFDEVVPAGEDDPRPAPWRTEELAKWQKWKDEEPARKAKAEEQAAKVAALAAEARALLVPGTEAALSLMLAALTEAKGEASAQAIRKAVEQVAKNDPVKQVELLRKAVAL
jgi:hypothetical protein